MFVSSSDFSLDLQAPKSTVGCLINQSQNIGLKAPPPPCCCSVAQLFPTLCISMDCSTPGFPVLHHLHVVQDTHVFIIISLLCQAPLCLAPEAKCQSDEQSLCGFVWSPGSCGRAACGGGPKRDWTPVDPAAGMLLYLSAPAEIPDTRPGSSSAPTNLPGQRKHLTLL